MGVGLGRCSQSGSGEPTISFPTTLADRPSPPPPSVAGAPPPLFPLCSRPLPLAPWLLPPSPIASFLKLLQPPQP
jgi:hypothetical protein